VGKKLTVLDKLKDERLHYFGKRLIYEEKPEMLQRLITIKSREPSLKDY
jgi:hypothetical protein